MAITKTTDFATKVPVTPVVPVVSETEKVRVQAVKDRIEAAKLKRVADKVVETPAEKTAREAAEAKELKQGVTKEEQTHINAAALRVKTVQAAIDAAKVVRDEKETAGSQETDGVKTDRLAKEAKDLKAAAVVNVVEPLSLTSDFSRDDLNGAFTALAGRINDLINLANK